MEVRGAGPLRSRLFPQRSREEEKRDVTGKEQSREGWKRLAVLKVELNLG